MVTFASVKRAAARSGQATLPGVPSQVGREGRPQVRRILQSPEIQPKLTVGPPGDEFEQEADRVADQVMRMPDSVPASAAPTPPRIQRKCTACEEEQREEQVQRVPGDSGGQGAPMVTPEVESGVGSLQGGGRPLADAARAFFEPRFGADLSSVRIHTDARAAATARAIRARAFTVGRDIVFANGAYAPGTRQGRHLLAHELTHVAQQNPGATPTITARDTGAAPKVRRSVESAARRIEELLSYGLFDWAITEGDAIAALETLSSLPTDLQRDVLRRIDIERLRDNLPAPYLPILDRILTAAGPPPVSVRDAVARIQDLLSYGALDWAITDSEAREAFRLLTSLPAAEQERVVRTVNYQRLHDNLPDAADRTALEALRTTAMAHETSELATMEGLRVRAQGIVTMIKANADAMTLPVPPASGGFETFLASEYLGAYCAAPSPRTAAPAIDQMVLEGGGRAFAHYGYAMPESMRHRAWSGGIGFIDTPSLLGTPAPGVVTATEFLDPWSQGPNPTQIIHFASGIKWSWAPAALVRWYFIHYEEVSEEGWQIFGLDSLNDIIAEEGGRLLAEDLNRGKSCSGGKIDLDPYFARGRAFLRGELSESRLEAMALRVHLPNLIVETGVGVKSGPLYSKTIMEQLMAGASDAAVLASPDARILTLLFHLLRKG